MVSSSGFGGEVDMQFFRVAWFSSIECLLLRIGLRLSFYEFGVPVLKHLKVSPFYIHSRSLTHIKLFRLCVKYEF